MYPIFYNPLKLALQQSFPSRKLSKRNFLYTPSFLGEPLSTKRVRRAAFDIGSGKIKMQVADVDVSINKIVKILFSDFMPLDLASHLVSTDKKFENKIQNETIEVMLNLKKKAGVFVPDEYHGISTESFRLAKNGWELADRIQNETKINISIVSKDEEGVLGYLTATSLFSVQTENVISWDSGNGSFQLTEKCNEGYTVFSKPLGKVPMKNLLLKIQNKNIEKILSPNPISAMDMQQALEEVKKEVVEIPQSIQRKLKQPDAIVLKIGGHPLAGFPVNYDISYVQNLLENCLGLEDNLIKKKQIHPQKLGVLQVDPAFFVSNLILTYGLMKVLNIPSVYYVGSSGGNARGLLLSEQYWRGGGIPLSPLPY